VGKGIEIDYEWVIERTIRSPLERILEADGIGWENVEGYANLNEWFG
jgi:DNA polymerase elongation subunit (family B)